MRTAYQIGKKGSIMKKHIRQPIIRFETDCMEYNEIPKDYSLFNVFQIESWGNKKDGFDANNRYHIMDVIVRDDANHREIMQGMKRVKLLKKYVRMNMLTITDDNEGLIFIESRYGEPLFTLEYDFNEWTKGKDRKQG